MQTKVCTKCHRELPTNNFQADKRRLFGVGSHCRDCKREYRQVNKDMLLIAQYQRRSLDKTITPQRRAWNALYYALRVGKIDKPDTCEVCNHPSNIIQGHHSDYTKPFDVTWCCQDCHTKLKRSEDYAKLCAYS